VLLGGLALAGTGYTAWAWTHASGEDAWLYHGGLLAGALAVAAVLAHVAVLPDGLPARLLSLAPLPALGRISYGVYLWHWPVFVVLDGGRTGLVGARLLAVRCAVTLLVSVLSYVVLERPVRASRRLRSGRLLLSTAAASLALGLLLVVGATTVPAHLRPTVAAETGVDGIDEIARDPARTPRPRERPTSERVPAHHWRPGQPLVVDVLGDSLAWSLVAYLPAREGYDVRDRTMLGCGITTTAPYRYFGRTYPAVPPKCRRWQRLWALAVASDDPDVSLVLVGRWETMSRRLGGRWTHVGEPAFDAHLRAALGHAIRLAGARGARVVLATEPYNRRGEAPDGSSYPEDSPERVEAWNRLLRDVAARHPGVAVLDLGRRVSPEGRFSWDAGGVRVRADGLHLTPSGVQQWIAPWLFPRLRALAPR
jgi:hypothetical protein